MKRFLVMILLVMLLLFGLCFGAWAKSPRDIVVDYAWEIYNFSWIATSPILLHNTNIWIPAGEIRGIPYTLDWPQNTYEDYKKLIYDKNINGKNNGLYDTETYSIGKDKNGNTIWRTSMKYGMACATFVTDCIKQGFLPYNIVMPKKTQTYFHNDGDIWEDYISVGDTTNDAYAELQKGDYLDNYDHVILVAGNDGKNIFYIDQTAYWDSNNHVGTHKGTYSYEELRSHGYIPMYVAYPHTNVSPTITTTSLPDAYIGEPYYAKVEATGTTPITYTLDTVALSSGFLCDGNNPCAVGCTTGIINGTPKGSPRTINIDVTAENSAGSDTKTFTVNVKSKGIPIDRSHFPDTNFRNCVRTCFDLNNDGYLSNEEIAKAKAINFIEQGISDTTGIKLLTELEWIDIHGNSIKNLDVSGLKKLSTLYCWENGMTSLQISGCTSLSDLWIHTNNLTTILTDDCPNLKRICMWTNTNLASLNLSGMASLEELWAAGCISLRKLNVKNNPNMKLLYVDKCSSLEEIYAYGSSSINSINLNGCNNLKTFGHESNVSVPGNKPTITTASLPEGYVGEAYSARVTATSTHPITGYSISANGIANGLKCDAETGEITGTPTTERTFSMTLYASNYVGTASKTFSVTVKTKPVITTVSLPEGKAGQEYYAKINATGTTPITWTARGLPSWLSLNASTGELRGTPTKSTSEMFAVIAAHGNLTASKTYTLNVTGQAGSGTGQGSPAEAKPEFKNFSIMMEGQIGINFYIYLPEIQGITYTPENCWVDFNIRGDTSHVPQPLDYEFYRNVSGLTLYGFRCYINAAQMADTITATLHYGNGQTITKDYSAKTYLNTALGISGFSQIVKNLMTAIKNYGHYVQPMLSKERGWIIGEKYLFMEAQTELTDNDVNEAREALKNYKFSKELKGTGITAINYSLTLGAETTINLYITPASGYSGNISAYLDGGTANMAVISGNKYKVEISNIAAKDLGIVHTIKIIADATSTVKISALSYADAILSSTASQIGKVDIDTMRKAATALYNYHRAAKAYADTK